MLLKLLAISILAIGLGLAIAVVPEMWGTEEKTVKRVNPLDRQRLVRTCVREAEQKLEAMGPFFGWDPDEVRQKCEAAVDEHLQASD